MRVISWVCVGGRGGGAVGGAAQSKNSTTCAHAHHPMVRCRLEEIEHGKCSPSPSLSAQLPQLSPPPTQRPLTHLERDRALLADARVGREARLVHLVQDLLLALGLLDEVGEGAARGDELLDVLDVVLLLEERLVCVWVVVCCFFVCG